METKGEWKARKVIPNELWIMSGNLVIATMHIADSNEEANAQLICASVNALKSINSDDPLAVALNIGEMYETLKDIIEEAEKTDLPLGIDLAVSIKVFGKQVLSNMGK